jgi:hypothetical protein
MGPNYVLYVCTLIDLALTINAARVEVVMEHGIRES